MKVLVVAPSLHTRGGITSVVRLHMGTKAWKEMNCEHLSTHDDRSALRKIWAAIWGYVKAPSMVAQADMVHFHLAGERSLLRKLPIAAMARLLGKPYIVHVHASSPHSLFDRTPGWATRSVLDHAARIVALSESWADAIRPQVTGVVIEVIPNPVRFFPIRRTSPHKTVLFAGKLEARKGYRTLLQAIPEILKLHPDAMFVFAGNGETAEASRIVERLGVSRSVQVLGWVSPLEMDGLYGDASVFCLPSRNEGVPMSVLEAMSHGVPVVCTPVGGLPEIIDDGKNAILAQVDDAASLTTGIVGLLDDRQHAEALGMAGRDTVYELCGLEQVGKRLSDLYNEIGTRDMSASPRLERVL
jgi:glycosyltransferase involved in cell wall biosynthesis